MEDTVTSVHIKVKMLTSIEYNTKNRSSVGDSVAGFEISLEKEEHSFAYSSNQPSLMRYFPHQTIVTFAILS